MVQASLPLTKVPLPHRVQGRRHVMRGGIVSHVAVGEIPAPHATDAGGTPPPVPAPTEEITKTGRQRY